VRLGRLEVQQQRTVEALGRLAEGQHALVRVVDRTLEAVEQALGQLQQAVAREARATRGAPTGAGEAAGGEAAPRQGPPDRRLH
jgi:hypothetical protein